MDTEKLKEQTELINASEKEACFPKNMHWTTKEDTERGIKRLNSHIPIKIIIPEEFNEENINE